MDGRISIGILIVGLLAAGPAAAQESETLGPTTKSQGPTREAQAATVLDTSLMPAHPHPQLRYQAFQRGFERDFGLPASLAGTTGGLLGLRARLEHRWGDTSVYHWIERGLAAYSWFRASTSMEKRGFDIRMDTDDVAQGKLGVQMTRPLGTAASE
jgi:hypothetical protein